MSRRMQKWSMLFALYSLGCGSVVLAWDGQCLLRSIKEADETFFAAVSLSITVTGPEGLIGDMGGLTMEGTLTVSGKSRGLILERVCFQPPEYAQPIPGHDGPRIYDLSRPYNYDNEWNMVFGRQQQHMALKTEESSALFMQSTLIRVAPSGAVTEEPRRGDLIRSPASDDEVMTLHLYRRILPATGRGYGQFLTSVDEVKTLPSGLLELIAAGGPPWGGRWTLTVDPALDYLVRSAVWGSKDNPQRLISTTGTLVQDGLKIPLEGTITDMWGGNAPDRVTVVEFKEVSKSRAEDAIKDLKKRLTADLPAGTSIIDYRENPEHPLFHIRDSSK